MIKTNARIKRRAKRLAARLRLVMLANIRVKRSINGGAGDEWWSECGARNVWSEFDNVIDGG